MQGALVDRTLLVRLLRMDLHDIARGSGRSIQPNDPHRRRRLRLIDPRDGKLDMPDGRRIGGPDGAEHGTLIAVGHCEFRGRGVGGEEDGGFVPGGFDDRAAAVAGFVAAGEENHPCFWAGEGVGG